MYGRKQTPPIVAKVVDKEAKYTEGIVKQIQQILASAEKNISAPAGNNTNMNAVLENANVKKAIANYKQKKQAFDKARAEHKNATEAAKKENTRNKSVDRTDRTVKKSDIARDVATKASQDAEAAEEAMKTSVEAASRKAGVKPDDREAIKNAIDKIIAKTNPISDNSKQQLTIVLPFFLQIYESLYDDKNYEGSTQISRHTTIPNRAIMEYVVREIQKIEKKHPHPQLFESIFYFWNIFNLSTALSVMMAYLSEVPVGESSESRPGQVATIVEKQLGNASSFQEWDKSMTKPHDYHIYTKVFGQKFNPFRYADGALLALTKHPFTTYNPYITRRDMEITVDKETGAFENITNTAQEPLPQIRGKKSSEKNPSTANSSTKIAQANATAQANLVSK
jgi:hypothetical protein